MPDVAGVLRAAWKLRDDLWGKNLDRELQDVPGEKGVLKYVPKKYLDSLDIRLLGYSENGLLVRAEYDVAYGEFDPEVQ